MWGGRHTSPPCASGVSLVFLGISWLLLPWDTCSLPCVPIPCYIVLDVTMSCRFVRRRPSSWRQVMPCLYHVPVHVVRFRGLCLDAVFTLPSPLTHLPRCVHGRSCATFVQRLGKFQVRLELVRQAERAGRRRVACISSLLPHSVVRGSCSCPPQPSPQPTVPPSLLSTRTVQALLTPGVHFVLPWVDRPKRYSFRYYVRYGVCWCRCRCWCKVFV